MNIMKQFIRNPGQALATLVLAAFAITLGLPAGEAGAADRPKWLEVKIAERKVVRNAKITDPDKPGYYEIFLRIRHTNKSADRVVTALYDKKGSFTLEGTFTGQKTFYANGDLQTQPGQIIAMANLRSTNVNRVRLDPGKDIVLRYNIPITKYQYRDWRKDLYNIGANIGNEQIPLWGNFKVVKWSYDLKVKSEGI